MKQADIVINDVKDVRDSLRKLRDQMIEQLNQMRRAEMEKIQAKTLR